MDFSTQEQSKNEKEIKDDINNNSKTNAMNSNNEIENLQKLKKQLNDIVLKIMKGFDYNDLIKEKIESIEKVINNFYIKYIIFIAFY